MNPHEHQTRRRSPAAENLAASWDQYLDSRGPRAHGDLLKAVDSHIRSEASRILGRRHPMLEEVAQEALVGAARRISTGERPDFPLAYLRKIVHNKVADMLRRETARLNREQQHLTPEVGAADASMSAEWHDFLDTLRDIVSSDEFWTLILHYHFDYSYGEIADLLDKEANAVRQIAHRGRRKCREHLTRLEGRVPAWVMLPDAGPESGGRVAESSDGDPPGLREPRMPDPADRSRRPSAGSDSAQANQPEPNQPEPNQPEPIRAGPNQPEAVNLPTEPSVEPAAAAATPVPTWRRRPRLRPDGRGRLFGNPTTVVPLTLVIALPLLFQVDRALDATVARPAIRTAQLVDDPGGTPPPSGPTISVTASTAPTDEREAPSTSAPPPDSSDPPTTPPAPTSSSTSTSLTTTSAVPTTTTSTSPTTVRSTTTQRPTTTRASTTSTTVPPTTRPSTTAPATSAASSSTARSTTSTSTTTTTPTTTTSTTTTTTSTTTSTTTERTTTSTSSSTTTTSGRDPGGGGDPPPNQ